MPSQIYLAPEIGSGLSLSHDPATWSETTGPFRSLVHDYMYKEGNHHSIHNNHRKVHLTWVETTNALLNLIETDARIKKVLPVRARDAAHLTQILNSPLSSFPATWRTNAKTFLENNGVNLEWVTTQSTLREVILLVIKLFNIQQMAHSRGYLNVRQFLGENLDLTVSQVPPECRDEIRDWLGSVGVDVSVFTASTTVREVLALLPAAFDKLYAHRRLDKAFHFAGEQF